MIFYYSATGNSQHVARRLADALDDRAVSILACREAGDASFELAEGEAVGFVTPTYFMGLPTLMTDFFDALDLRTSGGASPYAYLVATFGNFSGTTRAMAADALRDRGIPLAAAFGVRTVDTWTPLFDVSDRERNLRITREADARIDDIAARVRARETGAHRIHGTAPRRLAHARALARPSIHCAVLRGTRLRRLRRVRPELPRGRHPHGGRRARMDGGHVRAVPRVPASLPRVRHPARAEHEKARTVGASRRNSGVKPANSKLSETIAPPGSYA